MRLSIASWGLEVGLGNWELELASWGATWSLVFCSQFHNWRFSFAGSLMQFEIGSWSWQVGLGNCELELGSWGWQLGVGVGKLGCELEFEILQPNSELALQFDNLFLATPWGDQLLSAPFVGPNSCQVCALPSFSVLLLLLDTVRFSLL